jgi:hypothetical protein
MKQNQWFAVRCCCTPKKVFGFINLIALEESDTLPAHRTVFDFFGRPHMVKLLPVYINKKYTSCAEFLNAPPHEISYNIAEIAIYSDDRPLEFWRTIPGFVEGTTQRHDNEDHDPATMGGA